MSLEDEQAKARRVMHTSQALGIIGLIVGAYGILEGIRYQQTPQYQEYSAFSARVRVFEKQLYDDRVFGYNGILVEIRKPGDPRIEQLGKIKNELDVIDEARRKNYNESIEDQVKHNAVFWGLGVGVIGLSLSRKIRKGPLLSGSTP